MASMHDDDYDEAAVEEARLNRHVAKKAAADVPVRHVVRETTVKETYRPVRNVDANEFQRGILKEINAARQFPADYAASMERLRAHYKGQAFHSPEGGAPRGTAEGPAALDDALRFLAAQKPLPVVHFSERLSRSTADLVADQGPRGLDGDTLSDGTTAPERLRRYGRFHGEVRELMSMGWVTPHEVVTQLIIDDGDDERDSRRAIFNEAFSVIGAAAGDHAQFNKMAVIAFAQDFTEGDGAQPPITEQADGSLRIETAPLWVTVASLDLVRRGDSLCLTKTVSGFGSAPLVTNYTWGLPAYPLSIDARLHGAERILVVELRKPDATATGDVEVAAFDIDAAAGASADKVEMALGDAADKITVTFTPSKFATRTTVSINATTLSVKHVHTVEDDAGKTTVTSGGDVTLPWSPAPSAFQKTMDGDKHVLYIYKGTGGGTIDQTIHIQEC